jgi:hypothetical protein
LVHTRKALKKEAADIAIGLNEICAPCKPKNNVVAQILERYVLAGE